MSKCPKCQSEKTRKDGIVKQRQRYMCKECRYHFTVMERGKPSKMKRDALVLYLEGLGLRSIGRFLGVSHVTVYNWIKEFGKKVDEIRATEDLEVIEIDEMHTYIGEKKTTVGYGLLLIEMGKDLSTVKLGIEGKKLEESCGTI